MFVFSLILIAVLAAADQIIKQLVVKNISIGEIIEAIKIGGNKIFSLTHVRNPGAAWSIMQGKTWLLVILPVIMCLIAIVYLYKIRKGSKIEIISIAMFVAGGLGNLIDRIRIKEVVDYIKCDFITFPIFNLADICVTLGAIIFCINYIVSESRSNKNKKEQVSRSE